MTAFIISTAVMTALSAATAVFHKKMRKTWISVCVCAAVSTGGAIGCKALGFDPLGTNQTLYYEDNKSQSSSEKSTDTDHKGYLGMISFLAEAGEFESANALLSEYCKIADYSPEYMTLVAKNFEFNGDAESAKLIKKKLDGSAFDLSSDSSDNDKKSDREVRLAALAFWAARSMSENNGMAIGPDKNIEPMRALTAWMEEGSPYTDLPCMKKTLLAAELYMNDYGRIADDIMNEPDGNSLIVASQLLRNGNLRESDVDSSSIRKKMTVDAKEVKNYLKKDLSGKYSESDTQLIKKTINTLSGIINNDSNMLLRYTVDSMKENAAKESSTAAKVYLELADIAFESGNSAAGSQFVEKSLASASQSTDAEFASAVSKINEIINSSDDPEAKKQISKYVSQMTENRMPEGVPDVSKLPAPPSVPDDDDDEPSLTEDPDTELAYGGSSLEQCVSDSVNQLTGSINIVSVNKDNFPKLSIVAAVDENIASDADEFKSHISLVDTDSEISDYDVSKVEYNGINVVLVCDDSGSMNGYKSESLRNAVKKFIEKAGDDVQIGIVPFAGNVKQNVVCALGSSHDKLVTTTDSMRGDGNTNIYAAVDYALGLYPNDPNKLNIMILMSDGEDSLPSSENLTLIREKCTTNGISIYTMGLGGESSANVLESYSNYGGGSFYYVENASSIESFYNFIYNLGKNRYLISYEADDTFRNDRYAELSHDSSVNIYCRKEYTLYDDIVADGDLSYTIGDVVIYGLKQKIIYPSSDEQKLELTGSGFGKDDEVSVTLRGTDKFTCQTSYRDSEVIEIIVPGDVPMGMYDVVITYNKKRAVLKSELIISDGNTKKVVFGDYIFSASWVTENKNDNTITLEGVVDMNDWLRFLGTVTLKGNINDSVITLSYRAAYVPMEDENIGGLSGFFAKKGINCPLPTIRDIKLYNDKLASMSDEKNYPVEKVAADFLSIPNFVYLNCPSLALYPTKAVIDFNDFSLMPEFLQKIMKNTNKDFKDALRFVPDTKFELILSKDRIDADIEISHGHSGTPSSSQKEQLKKIGNLEFTVLGELELKLNTLDGDFSLKFMVNKNLLKLKPGGNDFDKETKGIGLEIAAKDWKLDKIMFLADIPLDFQIGPVPVSIDDFKTGLQDLSKIDFEKEGWESLFNAEWVGGMDISVAKVKDYLPALEFLVGDASLASLDDVTTKFRLKNTRFKIETKVKVLGFIEVGHLMGEIGCELDYENPLLELPSKPNGFIFEIGKGIKTDLDWLKIDVDGTGNFAFSCEVLGVWGHGNADFEIQLPIPVLNLSKAFHSRGDVFIGGYTQEDGRFVITFAAYGMAEGKSDGFRVIVDPDDIFKTRIF